MPAMTIANVTDLIQSEVLAAEYLMTLSDTDASVLTHPAIFRATATSRASNTVKVPHLGLAGNDLLVPHTSGTEVAISTIGTGHTDVVIAPRAKAYSVEDMARYVTRGALGPQMLARDLVISAAQTLVSLVAGITATFTASAGATGVGLSWAKILEAKGMLGGKSVSGQLLLIVHPTVWSQLEIDALALGYVAAQANSGIVNQGMNAYKGNYFGIDCFVSAHCPLINADADYAGGLFGPGALAYADAMFEPEADPNMVSIGNARLERDRVARKLETAYVFSQVTGASRAIDNAGVKLIAAA